MLATSATSFPGAAALRTPLQPKHDIQHRELTFVTQNLFANEEASPHHRARAFASFLLQTRPQFAAVQELMPWNAQILLESPVLRKLYPRAAADRGIVDKDWVWVKSPTGAQIKVRALVTERVGADTVRRW